MDRTNKFSPRWRFGSKVASASEALKFSDGCEQPKLFSLGTRNGSKETRVTISRGRFCPRCMDAFSIEVSSNTSSSESVGKLSNSSKNWSSNSRHSDEPLDMKWPHWLHGDIYTIRYTLALFGYYLGTACADINDYKGWGITLRQT